MSNKLAACLLNISAAQDKHVVMKVVKAAAKPGTVVLNTFSDYEYNRTVVTVTGRVNDLANAVASAAKEAYNQINLEHQQGIHPRLGAVDLIPFHPLTEETGLEECGDLAYDVAVRLSEEVSDSAFFFYGAADKVKMRGLSERRREAGWFKGELSEGFSPDIGVPGLKSGVTGIGATPYMTNFNISLETLDIQLGNKVLGKIRERSGGLLGVQGMAFPHQGGIEVACNVDMFLFDNSNSRHMEQWTSGNIEMVMGGYCRTSFRAIEKLVKEVISGDGVKMKGDSVVVGFSPEQARELTLAALSGDEINLAGKIYM